MERQDPFGWVGGTIDAQFAVEAVTGEGAFGVVYRGLHLGLGEPVAIKCLKIPAALTAEQRETFLAGFRDEARLLHRLSSRNAGIVQALDAGAAFSPNETWTPYFVMEWLSGVALDEDIQQRAAAGLPARSVSEAVALLAPVAEALAVAHEEQVTHRDIKPGNLFLVRHRGGARLKVLDFGIAKVLGDAPFGRARPESRAGLNVFTPRYGAPEQFSPDLGPTGPWTDVFAMALVLIELATGSPALAGEDAYQLFGAALDPQVRPTLAAGGVGATPEVEEILRQALEVAPARRLRDVRAMWTALEAAVAVETHGSRGAATSTRVGAGVALAETIAAPEGPPPGGGEAARPEAVDLEAAPVSQAVASFGENRVCTVLAAEVACVPGLPGRLGPEEASDLLDACFEVLAAQAERFGGVVQRVGADGLLAVFGLPRASETDASRAVQAALAMRAALARFAPPGAPEGAHLELRAGLDTSRVFARCTGAEPRAGLTVIGEAASSAARLKRRVPTGSIALGHDAHRQVVGLFEVEPLEAAAPGELGTAYRVLAPLARHPALGTSDFYGLRTRLAGRAAERQQLVDAAEAVITERRARQVTLVGAPGVGRTRMLGELFAHLAQRPGPFLILTAQGSPLATSQSYGLAASLVRRRLRIHEDAAAEAVERKLQRALRGLLSRAPTGPRADPRARRSRFDEDALDEEPVPLSWDDDDLDDGEVDDALAQLAALLTARPRSPSGPQGAPMRDDVGDVARHRIPAAVTRLLGLVASRVPVALLCDDLQWADDASLDLLDHLVTSLREAPLLVVCAARSDLYERRPFWGEAGPGRDRLELGPLPRRAIEEMIRDRLRNVVELPEDLVEALADRAEGSPLTVSETLHLLVDVGVLERRAGSWAAHAEQLGALTLPATVQGVIQARLDRLERQPRGALARGAVIGRTFWEGAVEHLRRGAGTRATGTPTPELLTELREKQLIRGRESKTFGREREYVFAESATQEVAYETLTLRVRRALHLRVAAWLEARGPLDASAALLALHLERGGAPRRAAAAHARAAAHAASLGRNAEALRHFERARDLHDEAPAGGLAEGAVRADVRVAPWADRARLRLDTGDVLRRMGRLDDAERLYGEARQRILRDERRAGGPFDPRDPIAWDARVDYRMALVHKVRGSASEARALVERAIERATAAGTVGETPVMFALLAFLHRRARDPEASWGAARQGLRVCRALTSRDEHWQEDVAQLLFGLGAAQYARGRMVAAERCYRQASRVVSESSSPHLVGVAMNGVAAVRVAVGDLIGARRTFLRSLRFKERAGDAYQIAVAHNNLAEVELRLGAAEAALAHARRGVRLAEQVHAGADFADFYRNLAEASMATGDPRAALDAGCRALELAEVGGRVYLGDVAVALARICAAAAVSASPAVRGQAALVATSLRASLDRSFAEGDLRPRADECRALLDAVEQGMGRAEASSSS